jgi:hypothetical protein
MTQSPLSVQLRSTSAVLLGLGIVLGLFGSYTYAGFPYAPFSQVNQSIARELKEDEVILHTNKITAFPACLYNPELPHAYLRDPEWSRSNTLSRDAQSFLELEAVEDLEGFLTEGEGVWVVFFEGELEDYLAAGEVDHPVFQTVEYKYSMITQLEFGDLRVRHYEK